MLSHEITAGTDSDLIREVTASLNVGYSGSPVFNAIGIERKNLKTSKTAPS
jgi:hypothetical protein